MTSAPAPATPRPPGPETTPGRSPILSLRLRVRELHDSRSHCQRLAEYVARFVASDSADPERFTARLSTYLVEVLTYAFRVRPGGGEIGVEVARTAEHLLAELTLPADPALAQRLRDDLEQAAPGRRETAATSLLELTAGHSVALTLRERPGACVIALTVPRA